MQAVMEAEVVNKTGAGLGERSPERLTHGNGYMLKTPATPWGILGGVHVLLRMQK